MFIFNCLWPQLYYLFRVFSIVNIYKTLNKLFKISFDNFPLYVQGWDEQRRVIVTYPVSESMWIHFQIKGPWLVFWSPSSPTLHPLSSKSLPGLESYKGIALLSGETVDSSTLLPPTSLSAYTPSVFLSLLALSNSPVNMAKHFFKS